jgi:hypothetical protein
MFTAAGVWYRTHAAFRTFCAFEAVEAVMAPPFIHAPVTAVGPLVVLNAKPGTFYEATI